MKERCKKLFVVITMLALFLASQITSTVKVFPEAQAQAGGVIGIAYSDDPSTTHYQTWSGAAVIITVAQPNDTFIELCQSGAGCLTAQADLNGFNIGSTIKRMDGFASSFQLGVNGTVYTATDTLSGGSSQCTLTIQNGFRYCGVAVPNPDDDGDGVPNSTDVCPSEFGTATDRPGCPDSDSDGFSNTTDNCPSTANAGQENADGDALGNACDNCPNEAGTSTIDRVGCLNSDTDGYSDEADNCPFVANFDQADFDDDGRGDVCDPNISAFGECSPDGNAGFTIFNEGTEDQTVEWEIVNPIDNSILGSDTVLVEAESVAYVTYGIVDGRILFNVTSTDEPVSLSIPDCYNPTPTVTPTSTPTTLTTPTPPPDPICGEVTNSESDEYPQVSYDTEACEGNVELPRDSFVPITIQRTSDTEDGSEIVDKQCPDYIIYQTDQRGAWDIWRTDSSVLDSEPNLSRTPLDTATTIYSLYPTQSPDGSYIAFSTNLASGSNFEIYIASVNTSGPDTRFDRATFNTISSNFDPVWSPGNPGGYDEGKLVVYESARNGNWSLYLLDVESNIELPLTDNRTYNSVNAYWHPEGDRILYQSDETGEWQIYELNLIDNTTIKLTPSGEDYLDAAYNSDGSRIAFRSRGATSRIYVMDADGSNMIPISNAALDATNPLWSPEDDFLVYEGLDGIDKDIYVYIFEDGASSPVTDNNGINDYAPTWRCTDNSIVFVSDAQDSPDIYATAIDVASGPIAVDPATDGSRLTQLTSDPATEVFPQGVPAEENGSRPARLPEQ